MDEGPPPFSIAQLEHDEEEPAFNEFNESYTSVEHDLDSLRIPSISRSPSPSPKMNGIMSHDVEEKENGEVVVPTLKVDIIKPPSPVGGIESFLEREDINASDLPVDRIGLSPAHSRGPTPEPPVMEELKSEDPDENCFDVPPPIDNLAVDHDDSIDNVVDDQTESIDNQGEDDDDDDFGDFDCAPPVVKEGEEQSSSPPATISVQSRDLSRITEEEWSASFESCSNTTANKEAADEADDDWAAFGSAPAPTTRARCSFNGSGDVVGENDDGDADDDDDWAADFASAPPPAAPTPATVAPPPVTYPTLPSLSDLSVDEGIWLPDAVFADDDGVAIDLCERMDRLDPRGEEDQEECEAIKNCPSLWLALRVVEDASALRHTWEGSESARQLYEILDVNPSRPNTRVSTGIPPLDAVLTPTPISAAAAMENGKGRSVKLSSTSSSISHLAPAGTPSSSSQLPTSSLIPSPILPRSATVSPATLTTVSPSALTTVSPSGLTTVSPATLTTVSPANTGSAEQFVAPPAEFDWDKSTLKNLAASQQVSSATMLDMDYLAGSSNGPPKIISSDSTLQRDLDAFGLSATSASAGMPQVKSSPSLLDTILSSAKSSSAPRYLAPSELSLDARALHDALPNIDYLAAQWVAFPVRGMGGDQ